MENILDVNYNGKKCYSILFRDTYHDLYKIAEELELKNRRICIVCDTNTAQYKETVVTELEPYVAKVITFTMPAGEENKNLHTVQTLYEQLILSKFDRNDVLFALGGGVVGDLVGFTAATYLRGIRFVQLPTSLLSMVDSSIGGKTGVDFDAYKNMVGAFHQPCCVYMNLTTLKTLPDEQFSSGMGEVIKYGYIKDSDFFNWLLTNQTAILSQEYSVVHEMVYRSCQYKKEVVEADPLEKGLRAILNFGHTIGHAIEKLKDFKLFHGQCVALGMIAANYIAYKKGILTKEIFLQTKDIVKAFHLPVSVTDIDAFEVVNATKNDKKMEANHIKFILIRNVGEAFIDTQVTDEDMIEAIQSILN